MEEGDEAPMGADNPAQFDLGLTFSVEPPGLVGTFVPRLEHRGPPGCLHGGLAATALDETMARIGHVLDGVATVTGTLELRYRKPVALDGLPVRIEAWREGSGGRRFHRIRGRLRLADGTVAVEASGLFVVAEQPPSRRK